MQNCRKNGDKIVGNLNTSDLHFILFRLLRKDFG